MNENVPLHTSDPKAREKIEWLISLLPPTNSLANPKGLEATYYGASHTIAWQLGLKEIPTQSLIGWTHRWYYQPLDYPRNLACWADPKYPVLVATAKQAEFLRNGGFPYAVPIGAPFVYQPPLGLPRQEGSLLIMPPHTNDDQEHDLDQQAWADYLLSLRPRFKQIVACVHRACVGRYWTHVLDEIGIPWVCGAHTLDMNSQIRMRVLFESFEFVNSSVIGSQVAYAAYAGARPSVSGPCMKTPPKALAEAPFNVAFPYLHMPNEIAHSRERVLRDFPFICHEPDEIADLTAWGAEMLGDSFKRPCEEVARLLGWQYDPNQPLYHISPFFELGPKIGWHDSYELRENQATIGELQAELSTLKDDHASLESRLSPLKEEIFTLKHEKSHLQATIDTLKSYQSLSITLQGEVTVLRDEQSILKRNLDSSHATIQVHQGTISTLQNEVTTLRTENSILQTNQGTISTLQNDVVALRTEQAIRNNELTSLRETSTAVQSKLAVTTAKLETSIEAGKQMEILWRSVKVPLLSPWKNFIYRFLSPSTLEKARKKQWDEDIRYLQKSRFFDAAGYLEHSPDVALAGYEPATHFVRHGEEEGRRPYPFYDTKYHGPKALAYRKQPFAGSYYVARLRMLEKYDSTEPLR